MDIEDPSNVMRNQIVRIADLVVSSETIDETAFIGCEIVGPAVLFLKDSQLRSNTFEADIDSLVWRLVPEQTTVQGAIQVRNCLFENCRFRRVGLVGAGLYEALGGGVSGPG
jgi:hypothetical protein